MFLFCHNIANSMINMYIYIHPAQIYHSAKYIMGISRYISHPMIFVPMKTVLCSLSSYRFSLGHGVQICPSIVEKTINQDKSQVCCLKPFEPYIYINITFFFKNIICKCKYIYLSYVNINIYIYIHTCVYTYI